MSWLACAFGVLLFSVYGYVAVLFYVRRHYLSPEERKREDEEIREELSIW